MKFQIRRKAGQNQHDSSLRRTNEEPGQWNSTTQGFEEQVLQSVDLGEYRLVLRRLERCIDDLERTSKPSPTRRRIKRES